jgi:hypothetical protein
MKHHFLINRIIKYKKEESRAWKVGMPLALLVKSFELNAFISSSTTVGLFFMATIHHFGFLKEVNIPFNFVFTAFAVSVFFIFPFILGVKILDVMFDSYDKNCKRLKQEFIDALNENPQEKERLELIAKIIKLENFNVLEDSEKLKELSADFEEFKCHLIKNKKKYLLLLDNSYEKLNQIKNELIEKHLNHLNEKQSLLNAQLESHQPEKSLFNQKNDKKLQTSL